jgi:hypothetical protein
LGVVDSTVTVRARLNALNPISQDWIRDINQSTPQSDRRSHQRRQSQLPECKTFVEAYGGDAEPVSSDDESDDYDTDSGSPPKAPSRPEITPEMQESFVDQRTLPMDRKLRRKMPYNYLRGLTDEMVEEAFQTCTRKEKKAARKYLKRVPNGLLILKGAAGCGKTFPLQRVLELQLRRERRVIVTAPTNQATNNIAERMQEPNDDKYLMFRTWSDRVKRDIAKSCDPKNIDRTVKRITAKTHDNLRYNTRYSLANALL